MSAFAFYHFYELINRTSPVASSSYDINEGKNLNSERAINIVHFESRDAIVFGRAVLNGQGHFCFQRQTYCTKQIEWNTVHIYVGHRAHLAPQFTERISIRRKNKDHVERRNIYFTLKKKFEPLIT